jgi:outer membrane biosynthesis protein TonB
MKRLPKFCLVFLLLISSSAAISQTNKPENPNSIGTAGNESENTQLKEFLKNEAKEYEPAKNVSPTSEAKEKKEKPEKAKIEQSLSLREKVEKERVEKERVEKEKPEKEKRERERPDKEKPEKGNKK